MINFSEMNNFQIYKYCRSNSIQCPRCLKTKKMTSFFKNETNTLNTICNLCDKREQKAKLEKEIMNILLSRLTSDDLE